MRQKTMDELLDTWMDLGPTVAPERLAEATSAEIRTMPQRRATWWPVRRSPTMSKFLGVGLAAAAIVVAAVIGFRLMNLNLTIGPVSTPNASPSVNPSSSPTAVHPGPLEPGTYELSELDGTDVRVQFTVPEGWSWNGFYLSKGAPNARGVVVSFWSGDLQVYTDPCQWEAAVPDPPTGHTASDLIEALAAQPMRNASQPESRTGSGRDGHTWPGTAVSLTVPDDLSFADCSLGQFRSWGPEPNERYAQGSGQSDYVWAMDVAGFRIVVDAAAMPDMPESLRSEAEAIMDSLVFWDTH
jgi:hypothetical protein